MQQDTLLRPDTLTSPPSAQIDRWAQGCQAIFAGFVAVALDHNYRPSITDFWKTPQRDMVLPTVKDIYLLHQEHEANIEEGKEVNERMLMGTLRRILQREDNKYTQPGSVNTSITPTAGVVQVYKHQPNEEFEMEWELTERGLALFGRKQKDEPGKNRDGGMSPGGAVPKWWNM